MTTRLESRPIDPPVSDAGRDRAPGERRTCTGCGYRLADSAAAAATVVPCHVRAFAGQSFRVWRCGRCRALHCLEIVDLATYYARYPFATAQLTRPFRFFYRNLLSRLRRYDFTPSASLLDYGCGRGLFLSYLRQKGYRRCEGYDPYARPADLADRRVLRRGAYDFVLLQDVLEHVEDPLELLAELDGCVAPEGRILVGTPNADRIDLARQDDFLNELHVPYHLHIYTREGVERMGRRLGWVPVGFYDRAYHDLPWIGLNSRAAKTYQRLADGTLDAVLEPVRLRRVLTSGRLLFHLLVGYWLSDRADMTVVFAKPGTPGRGAGRDSASP